MRYDVRITSLPAFLRAHGLKPNPDWGQHFLIDPSVLRDLIAHADLSRSDTVVEIGAGIGVLTKELLAHVDRVIAIEVDRRWTALLEEFVGPQHLLEKRLTIIQGNALKIPYPEEPYKIVANIPYHITSHLFKHVFLHIENRPQSLTILVQREVADKICATKRDQTRTILSNFIEIFGEPTYVRTVPPGAFLPPPGVDSAIIHVECFKTPKAEGPLLDAVLRILSQAFGKKRKMLRRSLGKFHGGMERLEAASIAPQRRPETLSVDEWIALAKVGLEDEH